MKEKIINKVTLQIINLLPKYLKYRIAISVIADVTVNELNSSIPVTEIKAMEAIKKYEVKYLTNAP